MISYICITFGPSEDVSRLGWWNRKQRFDTQRAAEKCGLNQLSIAGTFGYVVIEEGEDFWEVVDECGAPAHAVSISCNNTGTYSIQPAPQLVLV
jgi:hypothetical protein